MSICYMSQVGEPWERTQMNIDGWYRENFQGGQKNGFLFYQLLSTSVNQPSSGVVKSHNVAMKLALSITH